MKNFERVLVQENNQFSLNQDFLVSLEEVLEHFDWRTTFGETIELINDDVSLNQTYTDFNKFVEDWVYTFEEAMEDPLIDYSDWIVVFKANLI